MGRLTDNDKQWWIFTYARAGWKRTSFVYDSRGGEDDEDDVPHNSIIVYLFGWIVRVNLPQIIKPYKEFVDTSMYEWAKGPGYIINHNREYGFSLSEDFFQIFYGPQTNDSTTTKSWGKSLPWKQWRHISTTVFDKDMDIAYEQIAGVKNPLEKYTVIQNMPRRQFLFKDYDGELITAQVHVERWHWKFGQGWFKWLSLFKKDLIRTSIEMNLDKEMGPEKGSWKGGTVGLGFDMLQGESVKQTFIRWCATEQRSRGTNFKITYMNDLN